MNCLLRIFSFLLTILAVGITNNIVSAAFQFDVCGSYKNVPFNVFEIGQCQESEECFIDKGRNVEVGSWSFQSTAESHVLRLSVIIGSLNPSLDRSIQSELLFDEPDLCQLEAFRNALSVHEGSNPNRKQCHLIKDKLYQLPSYDFYVSRLLPSGLVNVTVLLRGDMDVLACTTFRATLVE